MKKLTAWLLLLSVYVSFVAPASTANAQIIGKAMDQKLKGLGCNSAVQFNQKLLNVMETKEE